MYLCLVCLHRKFFSLPKFRPGYNCSQNASLLPIFTFKFESSFSDWLDCHFPNCKRFQRVITLEISQCYSNCVGLFDEDPERFCQFVKVFFTSEVLSSLTETTIYLYSFVFNKLPLTQVSIEWSCIDRVKFGIQEGKSNLIMTYPTHDIRVFLILFQLQFL